MTRDDRHRLAKLLGKIGSFHDAEVLSAVRMAHRLVIEAGLTWDDVILDGGNPAATSRQPTGNRHAVMVRDCLDFGAAGATGWERNFLLGVAAVLETGGTLSPKQAATLERIAAKIQRYREEF